MKTEFLREAIRLASSHSGAGDGGPFGAVVVRDGDIVSRGWNCVTSSPDPTAHAEVMAIRGAARKLDSFDLSDCEIYSSCEPCPMCLCAILWARIPALYYAADQVDAARAGFNDSEFYRQISLPAADRSLHMVQALQEEAIEVFKTWQDNPARVEY